VQRDPNKKTKQEKKKNRNLPETTETRFAVIERHERHFPPSSSRGTAQLQTAQRQQIHSSPKKKVKCEVGFS
jgi:hypothetical protein